MAITVNYRTFPVSWLTEQRKNGNLNTDISIQRPAVWTHLYQSNLILAMMRGVPINNLWLVKEKADTGKKDKYIVEKYIVIDGKQRTLTLCSFIADNFPLSKRMRYKTVDTVNEAGESITADVSGKKFSELEKDLQNRLLQYQLTFTIFDHMQPDELSFSFYMGNQSAPLSNINFLPVVLGEHIMKQFNELSAHPFLTETVKLTTPALRKRDDLKIIVQFLILNSNSELGFSGREIIFFCDMISDGTQPVSNESITKIFSFLHEAVAEKRAYLRPMHLPIIMHIANKAIEKEIDPIVFGKKLDEFFAAPDEEFKEASQHGSSKKANIQTRLEIMSKYMLTTTSKKPRKITKQNKEVHPISDDDLHAMTADTYNQIVALRENHAKMKEANEWHRKHNTLDGFYEHIEDSLKHWEGDFKPSHEGTPFPTSVLRKSTALISKLTSKLVELEDRDFELQQKIKSQESKNA